MIKKIVVSFSLITVLLISGLVVKSTNQEVMDDPILPKVIKQVATDDPIHPKANRTKQTKWI